MTRRYLAFDIEMAKVLPSHVDDLLNHRPLGITCIGMLAEDETEPHLWYSVDSYGSPARKMSQRDLQAAVSFLESKTHAGYTILSWNGLSFDFSVLAEESNLWDRCRQLAINHVDPMFHVLCLRGFGVKLTKAAKALGIPGKYKDLTWSKTPRMWARGRTEPVLQCAKRDCEIVLQVARISERRGAFSWVTRRGYVRTFDLPRRWFTVREAMDLPIPDTSWMDTPWPRSKFNGWLFQT